MRAPILTLPPEILKEFFLNLPHYGDAIMLASTCQHFHAVWTANAAVLSAALLPTCPIFYRDTPEYNPWSTWAVAVRLYDLRHADEIPADPLLRLRGILELGCDIFYTSQEMAEYIGGRCPPYDKKWGGGGKKLHKWRWANFSVPATASLLYEYFYTLEVEGEKCFRDRRMWDAAAFLEYHWEPSWCIPEMDQQTREWVRGAGHIFTDAASTLDSLSVVVCERVFRICFGANK